MMNRRSFLTTLAALPGLGSVTTATIDTVGANHLIWWEDGSTWRQPCDAGGHPTGEPSRSGGYRVPMDAHDQDVPDCTCALCAPQLHP